MDDMYPSKKDLKKIREWPIADTEGLITYLRGIWNWPEMGVQKRGKTLKLITGGWSGNEDIIGALHRSFFWMKYWESSHRGGLYIFKIK